MNDSSTVLTQAITKLLKPLVRLLLRNGIAFNALSELLKKLYVDVAETEFTLDGKKQSVSRIATLTGLNRKEVARAKALDKLDLSEITQQFNRAARVVSGWRRDTDFHTKSGKVADLNLDSGANSFKELVKRYSGDIPPTAITDELLHVGAIKLLDNGKLRLLQHAYIPSTNTDEKLRILGTDVSDLIRTIDHNIVDKSGQDFFQRKVAYDAINASVIPTLRNQLSKNAQHCLEELDELLAKHDSDTNPTIKEKGTHRIGVGIYYFEEKSDEAP
ncbi:MAG: DUF6502 family protein [Methylophagaceae bacterium]